MSTATPPTPTHPPHSTHRALAARCHRDPVARRHRAVARRHRAAAPPPAAALRVLLCAVLGLLFIVDPAAARAASQSAASEPASADAVSAEQRALDLVDALAGRDVERVFATLRLHSAPSLWSQQDEAAWRAFAERLTADLGGAEVMGVDLTGDHVLLELAPPEAPPVRLSMPYDPAADDRLSGFSLEPLQAGGGFDFPQVEADPRGDRRTLASALDAFFDRVEADHGFSGVALVAVDGEPVYSTARGLASRRYGVANTLDTRFDVGSINKSFTRVVVGRLLAAGELALDDTVADHLPDYPDPDVARRVTLAHLLEHTSGIPDVFGPELFASSKALYTSPADFFPLFAGRPLLFEPGSQRRYSNSGFMVLGAVIEAVTGKPYPQAVEEMVFRPAGMADAGFFRLDGVEPRVATGYTEMISGESGEVTSNVHALPVLGSPAGSAHLTAADLLAFDVALRAKRLLPAGHTRWYFEGEVGEEPADYASGSHGTGIAGGAPGVSAVMESDGRLTVIVLSNFDEPLGERAGIHLYRQLAAD